MKRLHLTFMNSEAKKHKLVPKVADENLTKEQVQQAMQDITALNMFEKEQVALYQEAIGAKYVETIETILF